MNQSNNEAYKKIAILLFHGILDKIKEHNGRCKTCNYDDLEIKPITVDGKRGYFVEIEE